MSFSVRIPVYFRDLDVMGHVNNAMYFTFMETARTEYWAQLFHLKDLRQLSFIVAHAECDFKIAAKYGDELEVSIRTSEIRNTSFDWIYEIRNVKTRELVAVGKTIQVYYDYSAQKPVPVPPDVRSKLLT
jgi:acyl-CoA thioester hydrolase